jgi:hypothetical protein
MAIADIFFSYSSKDRDRVRAVRDALASQGFEIFWDQSVPPGLDWDTWIRQHLNEAKCALVFWSTSSVGSDNVRHEATVAKQQGKLIPVLLDPLTVEQFPMGLYSTQGADLTNWTGGEQEQSWSTLKQQVEFKLTPLWVRRLIDGMEAELVAERARREGAERRDRTLRDQIIKEAQAQQQLRHERDDAMHELAAVKSQVETLRQSKAKSDRDRDEKALRIEQLESEQQGPPREAEAARRVIADLENAVSEITAARDKAIEQNSGLQRRLDAAEAEARTANAQAETLVAQLRDAQAVNALSGRSRAAPSPKASPGLTAFLTQPETAPPPLPRKDRREPAKPAAQQQSPPSLSPTGQTSHRRPIIEAMAFAAAVPCVLIGAALLFSATHLRLLGLYDHGEQTGWFAAGIVTVAYAAIRLYRRRAIVTNLEIALYWLGCALAIPVAIAAFCYAWSGNISGSATGFLLGFAVAFGSAIAITRLRRDEPMGGTVIAIYVLGCLLSAGIAIFTISIAMVGSSKSAQTGLFVGAGISLLSVLAAVYLRRAVLEGTEIALYWFGGSIAVASGLAAFLAGIGVSSSQDRSAFVGFGIAAAAALTVAVVLILRRRASLTVAEIIIYAFGGAIAVGYLVGCAFEIAFGSTDAALFFGIITPLVVWGGLGTYARRRRDLTVLLPGGGLTEPSIGPTTSP